MILVRRILTTMVSRMCPLARFLEKLSDSCGQKTWHANLWICYILIDFAPFYSHTRCITAIAHVVISWIFRLHVFLAYPKCIRASAYKTDGYSIRDVFSRSRSRTHQPGINRRKYLRPTDQSNGTLAQWADCLCRLSNNSSYRVYHEPRKTWHVSALHAHAS